MENNNNAWVWILVIVLGYFAFFHQQKYEGLTAEEWFYEYADAEDRASEYEDALDQANSNIENAKYYAWESYEEMGDALDYLEPVYP